MTHNTQLKTGPQNSAILNGKLEIFELKQLADMEAEYRKICQQALTAYKIWKTAHSQETDMIALLYGNLEGVVLRRHAEIAAQAYWVIRQDFRRLFKEYIATSCSYKTNYAS